MGRKKKSSSEGPAKATSVMRTGGEIDELTLALFHAVHDKDNGVHEAVSQAIRDVGLQQPEMVLSTGAAFLNNNRKVPRTHRVLVLTDMHAVLVDALDDIPKSLGRNLVALGMTEMTGTKDVKADWQGAASTLLVELGKRFGAEVLDSLLGHFEPNTMPHYFTLKTMGDFARSNPMYLVPNLKSILGRMLPLLGGIKHNNQKWVFAASMGRFCEAIRFYLEEADDPEVSMETFEGEVFSAMELMFNTWLENKEIRLATLEAIGNMSALIARDEFESWLPKLVNTFILSYKKTKTPLPITQGLVTILETSIREGSRALDCCLKETMAGLHPYVCMPVDESNPDSVMNHEELLRCYEVIGRVFSEYLVDFLVRRCDEKTPASRIGTLAVLRHIVLVLDEELESQKELIVSGIKPLLADDDFEVRRAFSKTIVAMAQYDYLSLEGGEYLVEYVVANAAIPHSVVANAKAVAMKRAKKGAAVPKGTSPGALRKASDVILHTMTRDMPNMTDVLWPFLLECIEPAKFTIAAASVCKSLSYLADLKRDAEDDDYYIDFDRQVNLPKPQAIIARLLTLLSTPNERGSLGLAILQLLLALSEILHPSIADMWFDLVPKLVKWLKAHRGDDYKQAAWEELILRFLSLTIDEVNDDDWTITLGHNLSNQFELYQGEYTGYKRMVHKLLGTVLKKTRHKKFVREQLADMFATLDWADADERTGFAQGYGMAASTHLDSVLEKLQHLMKNDMVRKSKGFLGLKKDKSQSDVENIRCSVVLSFGYAATYADKKLIQSRIEVHIINHLLPQFVSAKLPSVQEALVRASDLIGKAMHPDKLGDAKFVLKQRDDLLTAVVGFISSNTTNSVKKMGFGCCETLVRLLPILDPELLTMLVSSAAPQAYDLVLESSGRKKRRKRKVKASDAADGSDEAGPSASRKKGDEAESADIGDDDEEVDEVDEEAAAEAEALATLNDALANHNNMVSALLYMDTRLETLLTLFRNLESFVASSSPDRRARSVVTFQHLLTKYVSYKRAEDEPSRDRESFEEMGHWIGVMIPRCTDPDEEVRVTALSNIELLLYIDYVLVNDNYGVAPSDFIKHISTLKERIREDELNAQFAVVNELTRVLVKTVPETELPDLLMALMDGLVDPEESSANGTCVVLNGLMRSRGRELEEHIGQLIHAMLFAMENITTEQTMNGTLHALRTLGTHHLTGVVDELLTTPLPQTTHVIKSLQVLGKDVKLAMPMIDHLKDIMNNDMPYEVSQVSQKKFVKKVKSKPMAATAAIANIFDAEELEDTASSDLAALLSTLILRVGTVANVVEDEARTYVVEALRRLLNCAQLDELMADLEEAGVLEQLSTSAYPDALTDLARLVCEHLPDHLREIYVFLSPFLSRNYEEQRVAVAAVFAEFINNCDEDVELLKKLLNALLVRLVDDDPTVKLLSLRGLGNLASAGEDEVNKYSTTVLSALMGGIDDATEVIALEAMSGLSKILELVDEANVAPVLITLCLRMKPSFRDANPAIRAAAITLFGTLWRFGNHGESEADFFEQIQANLMAFVLHADDDDEDVAAASRHALFLLAELLRHDDIAELFQALEEDEPDYEDWLDSVSQTLIAHFPERLNYYVMECVAFFAHKSWHHTKANAAILTGFFIGNMDDDHRRTVNLSHVCGALKNLLREPSARVRVKAAEAIALLYDV
ncbi:uncharacterized protein AMSG_01283 [Thecamonas trahens ATCC 50062]|uniref:Uncharacterized protein n=1 Tax=Thecamonas trahens ATCC 50062 TaxID=461836 RepID=A0A0L0DQA1_THETB|nr:hypothetical protein AMSG_01283 [Thecamonas trahens ATCC 50062]KNC53573.1 hypothetical protein AMSG_01283 [Thecamonas trahens ATCC 50062]|eukprot:XP_013761890.1 hypothetical protein AMSG_01283 [Thecamonas trahens ATCC 50062]